MEKIFVLDFKLEKLYIDDVLDFYFIVMELLIKISEKLD